MAQALVIEVFEKLNKTIIYSKLIFFGILSPHILSNHTLGFILTLYLAVFIFLNDVSPFDYEMGFCHIMIFFIFTIEPFRQGRDVVM